MAEFPTINSGGKTRVLNVRADAPDIRDRIYEPALLRLKPVIDNSEPSLVLDQGQEGACTGFGLAAVINLLNIRRNQHDIRVSPRMLYEMAKKHDEWPGEDYSGSSCRGAIRGWYNMGVCTEQIWPYVQKNVGELTVERAREARGNTLGAYYRLRPEITDYHAAMNEVGAIYVSANVHDGWNAPGAVTGKKLPHIPWSPTSTSTGGHAFAIVGYNERGFVVQNSWGEDWGEGGFALWLYEDWLSNVMDGWVFRLALPTPQIFGFQARQALVPGSTEELIQSPPKRHEIAGHFVHFDDGKYKEKGNYWSSGEDVQQTAENLHKAITEAKNYKHLLIYAHGGLNSPKDSARRIRALKHGFMRNGIYPYHIMYDTGLAEEVKDLITKALGFAKERAAGFSDWWDGFIENTVRKPVTPIWEEMKRDARLPFKTNGDGENAISSLVYALRNTQVPIHLVGHSTGAILLGHLLKAFDRLKLVSTVKSCSLMAPACTIEFFDAHYRPRLGKGGGQVVRLPRMRVYNLKDNLEKDDTVAFAYRKSLLYLVSRALEREQDKPLLGMENYATDLASIEGLEFVYSDGRNTARTRCASTCHGGFDNDPKTMNDILKGIIGKRPVVPFNQAELKDF